MPLVQTRGAASAQGFGEFAQATTANYIEDFFQIWLGTGTGTSATVTTGLNGSTKETLVWTKKRSSGAVSHQLVDNVRGATKHISSDSNDIQFTNSQGLTAFNSTGFTLGTSTDYNGSAATYVYWQWVSQPKFFDIVTYTGTGTNQTIAHNLGSVPGCIFVKRTDIFADWAVYHRSLANTQYLVLNATATVATGATWWNSTTATSTVFSVGTDASVNASSSTYVAYLFAHDAGGFGLTGADNVVSCGSFTTGASGATSVTLGWEPQYILVKSTTAARDWVVVDAMRGLPATGSGSRCLAPNSVSAENTDYQLNINATGFSFTEPGGPQTYIYIAIRRGPMKVPTDATKVFIPLIGNNTQGTQNTTNFPVDMQFAKYRSGASGTYDADRLRGVSTTSTTGGQHLVTSSTAAETSSNATQFWNNTGFQTSSGWAGTSMVYYNWARAPGFFDEVCYTGTGSATTITHNLTVVPELMIVKNRGAGSSWFVYAAGLGNTKALYLEDSSGSVTAPDFWDNTTPTASVFTVGSYNSDTYPYVAYLFATCPGVSKVGSYTGNGTTQTINCGFTGGARFVLIKRSNAYPTTGDWYVYDTARGMTTLTDPYFLLNSSAAEVATLGSVTTVATGFALDSAILAAINVSAGTYIFLAIA